jgi:formate dehydrogenase iron-sulfur subunit
MRAAILTDVTKCIGCQECVRACKLANGLGPELPHRWNLADGLSARSWTSVVEGPRGSFVRKQCRHCLQPACVSACPVAALRQTDSGAVIYDRERCMGCRYCMMACPFGVPRYEWDQPVPYVRKCTLCLQRLRAGQRPACTEACPTKATVFGDRGRLIEEAHRRIRERPELYWPKVWGEEEVGGTSVLYVAPVDLTAVLAGRPLEEAPLPERTRAAMQAVPFAFTGVVATMAGLRWVIERRMKRQAEEGDEQGA